jgi:hypothetical protein
VRRASIRDVIAFPKTQRAACLLTNAPSEAAKAQLDELALRYRKVKRRIKQPADKKQGVSAGFFA